MDPSKPICLFGLGTLLDECFELLLNMLPVKPTYASDNAQEKWGQDFHGLKCISPETVQSLDKKTNIVITVRNYDGIYAQLAAYGFTNIHVCNFVRGYNVIDSLKPLNENSHNQNADYDNRLRGKWAFVTGASRGIGFLIARELAGLGVNLIAHCRNTDHLIRLESECDQYDIQLIKAEQDLIQIDQLDGFLASITNTETPIDIVYNNAGISPPNHKGAWDIPSEDFLDSFKVNTLMPIRICNHFIPMMIKRGFGRIVNISSSIQKRPLEMAYACSKAALDKYVNDMAPSLAGTGVALSLLDPGWVKTDMGGDIAPHPPGSVIPGALLGAIMDDSINGQWITAQDFAGMDLNTALNKAAFILKT